MKGSRRSKVEITIEILKCTQLPIKKTKLMYAANLSWDPLLSYLAKLKEKGLIEEIPFQGDNNRTLTLIQITKKGSKFLKKYEMLQKELEGL